jgi:hypothetical protein
MGGERRGHCGDRLPPNVIIGDPDNAKGFGAALVAPFHPITDRFHFQEY